MKTKNLVKGFEKVGLTVRGRTSHLPGSFLRVKGLKYTISWWTEEGCEVSYISVLRNGESKDATFYIHTIKGAVKWALEGERK